MRPGALVVLAAVALAGCAGQPQAQPAPSKIAVGLRPGVVALGAGAAWVPNTGDGTLSKVDPKTNRVLGTWRVGSPQAMFATGCACYSVHQCPNGTFRVRKCDVPTTVAVGAGSVWVPRNDRQSLLRLDPVTGKQQAEIPLGAVPWDLSASASAVWVTDYFGDKLIHVDPASNRVVAELDGFPDGPGSVLQLDGAAWVSAVDAGELVEVDGATNRIVAQVPVLPGGFAYVGPQPLSLVSAKGAIWTRDVKVGKLTRVDPVSAQVSGVYDVDSFFGRDGLDAMGVSGDHLWLGGLRLQCFDMTTGAVTSRASVTATAVSGGGDGTLWLTDVADRVEHVPAPSCPAS